MGVKWINTMKIIAGLLIANFGTALLLQVGWGSQPVPTFFEGMTKAFHISFSLAALLANAFFLMIVLMFNRKLIGIGTVITTFFSGVFLDWNINLVSPWGISTLGLLPKGLILLLGIVISAVGVGYYIAQNLGAGTLDGFSLVVYQRFHLSFVKVRWAVDVLFMIVGILMGASWGVGTVLSVILAGPIISWVIWRESNLLSDK